MNRPSEELLHKTLENRATAAEAASVAEWLATESGQARASRYIGRDFDRQESCGEHCGIGQPAALFCFFRAFQAFHHRS